MKKYKLTQKVIYKEILKNNLENILQQWSPYLNNVVSDIFFRKQAYLNAKFALVY